MPTKKLPKPRGRPRGGLTPGEKVRDYPRLTLRLSPETRARLDAWSAVTKQPAWRLLEDAVNASVRELPTADRALIEKLARHTTKAE